MSDSTGGLRAVPGPAEASAEVFNQDEHRESKGTAPDKRTSWPLSLILLGLVLGLVASGVGWASAHQRSQALEAKLQAATGHLEAARSKLSNTRAALEARRAHLSQVREGVGALTLELEALTELLAQEPEDTP